jgi:hypothetical protein
MTAQLSFQDGYSIGGPMDIGQGYRWNVPVVTYGYDPSFLEYFGSNGVSAVDAAIQILNDLPAASSITLTNYLPFTLRMNYRAQAQGLVDLKSAALGLMIEQMGLTMPGRFVFCLRSFTNTADYTVISRNFDPESLAASSYINTLLYGYYVLYNPYYNIAYASPFVADPEQRAGGFSAIADYLSLAQVGRFYTGLTFDDVGGLRYLLSTNNVALENLLPGVTGSGTNASNYVMTALRPGVDKITFVRLSSDPLLGQFVPTTNQYVDSYITNNIVQHQTLQRVITKPDILFTGHYSGIQDWSRSGTGNWVNMGAPSNAGPGVIQPPIEINFNRLGSSMANMSASYPDTNPDPVFDLWGSFDGTTNPPVVYPATSTATNSTEFHLWLLPPNLYAYTSSGQGYYWNLQGQPNDLFQLQTSTNLSDWVNVTSITNLGGTFTYLDFIYSSTPQRYFRTIPQ